MITKNAVSKPVLVKASLMKVRLAPRKIRLVCALVRQKTPAQALTILANTPKRAAPLVRTLLASAIANAMHNFKLDYNRLTIAHLFVNEGKTLKRSRPRARGRTYQILKRTSHVHVVLQARPEPEASQSPAPEVANGSKN